MIEAFVAGACAGIAGAWLLALRPLEARLAASERERQALVDRLAGTRLAETEAERGRRRRIWTDRDEARLEREATQECRLSDY